jgi:hypothetical protein
VVANSNRHQTVALFFREQESHEKPGTETLGSGIIGANKPIPKPAADLYRLLAEFQQRGDSTIDRHRHGTDGRPRSWHVDVDEDKCGAELIYLRKEIYQRDIDIVCREITARERFSNRA